MLHNSKIATLVITISPLAKIHCEVISTIFITLSFSIIKLVQFIEQSIFEGIFANWTGTEKVENCLIYSL